MGTASHVAVIVPTRREVPARNTTLPSGVLPSCWRVSTTAGASGPRRTALKDVKAVRAAKYHSERRSLMGDLVPAQRTNACVVTVIASCPLGILNRRPRYPCDSTVSARLATECPAPTAG